MPELLLSSLFTFGTAMLINRLVNPYYATRRRLQEDVARLRSRFGSRVGGITALEVEVAQSIVVDPASIDVSFAHIGGHSELIRQLREEVLLPLLRPELLAHSKLLRPTKGVLLHGPPGTGKTMLAKAIAKEAGCAFLNVSPSSMLSKWYGESQKRVAAIWSVAHRLAPSLLFVDEMDCLFRARTQQDHEATAAFQAEWLTHWDGLLTRDSARVLVIGTTNRPANLDPAIGRRMARRFYVGLPSAEQRRLLLEVLLRGERLSAGLDLGAVAAMTEHYSGSDLKELCRAAAIIPVREYLADHPGALQAPKPIAGPPSPAGPGGDARAQGAVRELALDDFVQALRSIPPTAAGHLAPRGEAVDPADFHDATALQLA